MSDFWRSPRSRVFLYTIVLGLLVVTIAILYRTRYANAPNAQPMVCATDSVSRTTRLFSAPVQDIALQNTESDPVMLHELSNQKELVVLVFCSSTCPCSDGYSDRLRSLLENYGPRGVAFYGIHSNVDESIDQMKAYVHRKHYPLPILQDRDAAVADLLGALITPEVFVFNKAWSLEYHGQIDDDKSGRFVTDRSLACALDTLLAGKHLRHPEKISRGCAIVRNSPIPPM